MHPIRRKRVEQRLSLRELARRSGVPAGTISGIERGSREPRALTLAKLADALEVDIEDLSPKAPTPSPSEPQSLIEWRRYELERAVERYAEVHPKDEDLDSVSRWMEHTLQEAWRKRGA
jgi:transcriptional regulator with XRE-family HTH domain